MKSDRDRIDREFVEEYMNLCKKYNRYIWVDWTEGFNVGELEKDGVYLNIPNTQAENEEINRIREENERKRKEEESKRREDEHRKVVEEYVAGGGKLDDNGNIPIPKGYCEIISWR